MCAILLMKQFNKGRAGRKARIQASLQLMVVKALHIFTHSKHVKTCFFQQQIDCLYPVKQPWFLRRSNHVFAG